MSIDLEQIIRRRDNWAERSPLTYGEITKMYHAYIDDMDVVVTELRRTRLALKALRREYGDVNFADIAADDDVITQAKLIAMADDVLSRVADDADEWRCNDDASEGRCKAGMRRVFEGHGAVIGVCNRHVPTEPGWVEIPLADFYDRTDR
jgi:hypothetical protein